MKPRKRIDAEKVESEIKKDYYTCQPAPSELTYGPEQREGCPMQGLRAISLPVER
ncbi:hypothetical protein UFOVP1165_19 [uncultured Caudovirales phage]|uniref:Uncharacterized protein n=1 Tax=uncultured Caudovirales phage TaxID=2100421 RepID=A0A6J5R0G2_9CAUD|nr:hypothetical protein UFOVP1165_19 [uncultured Caudovirales phage]